MKKILLGTTALIGAAGLFASAALADAPKITVGGIIDFQAGYVSEDLDANTRQQGFRNDTEVNFNIDGKSDSGLGYGAVIDLEADVTGDSDNEGLNASRTYVYLDGTFGRFELGSNTGAAETLKVDAASIARATGGIDGDWTYFATANGSNYITTPSLPIAHGSTLGLGDESTDNANKITYYSPRFSGFQVGVSYTVDSGERGQGVTRADNNAGSAENLFDLAANYEGQFDQIGLAAAVTGVFGDSEVAALEDVAAWNAGAKVTFAGFSVAASYGDWDDSLQVSSSDADYWTLGGAYDFGAFGASVTYLNSELGNNDFDNLVIGADYKLAPGLTPYAEVSFYSLDNAGALNNDGTAVIVGTELAF